VTDDWEWPKKHDPSYDVDVPVLDFKRQAIELMIETLASDVTICYDVWAGWQVIHILGDPTALIDLNKRSLIRHPDLEGI
jgi:hypothetical protein